MSGLEGTYRSDHSHKREQEVAERLAAGMGHKQIAADLGITHHAVNELIEKVRAREAEAPAGTPPQSAPRDEPG